MRGARWAALLLMPMLAFSIYYYQGWARLQDPDGQVRAAVTKALAADRAISAGVPTGSDERAVAVAEKRAANTAALRAIFVDGALEQELAKVDVAIDALQQGARLEQEAGVTHIGFSRVSVSGRSASIRGGAELWSSGADSSAHNKVTVRMTLHKAADGIWRVDSFRYELPNGM